jgi:hypothetical protein
MRHQVSCQARTLRENNPSRSLYGPSQPHFTFGHPRPRPRLLKGSDSLAVGPLDKLKLVEQKPAICLRWPPMNASNYNVSSEVNRRYA